MQVPQATGSGVTAAAGDPDETGSAVLDPFAGPDSSTVPASSASAQGARVVAVLAAAGNGTRLGRKLPKAFVDLAGRTLLERALDGLAATGSVERVAVVVGEAMLARAQAIVSEAASSGAWPGMQVELVLGGAERADSVRAGLERLAEHVIAGPSAPVAPETTDPASVGCAPGGPADVDLPPAELPPVVLVHDAARCLTPPDVFHRVIAHTRAGLGTGRWAGTIPVMPVVDTIKRVDAEGLVTSTPPRSALRAVQTPQGFGLRELLEANLAFQQSSSSTAAATDDASIMELAGHRVATVPGDARALKITTPEDYDVAAGLAAQEEPR